jgi:hypothetical protein
VSIDTQGSDSQPDPPPLSFEDAVRKVLRSPQTPEQIAKKAARKARAEERKKQKQTGNSDK